MGSTLTLNSHNSFYPDFGCYYHECFLRGLPKLTCLIRRLPPNLGKSTPFAEGEPNFYLISDEYPLPGSKQPSKTPRPRAASLDTSPTLSSQPLVARRGTSAPVLSSDPKICHVSSLSIRPPTIPETSVPKMAAPTEPSASGPLISGNTSNQTAGYFYPPPSNQGYSQPQPLSSNYTPIYPAGQYYDNYPIQGQPFSRALYHPADPRSSFQFQQLPSNVAPIEYANQQYSSYLQKSQQVNSCVKDYPRDVGPSSSLNPSGQKNILDPFEPIPLSRSNSKKDSEVQVDDLNQNAHPTSS